MNAYLGGINLVIAAAHLVFAALFFVRLYQGGLPDPARRIFLCGMGVGYVVMTIDYSITAALRIEASMMVPVADPLITTPLILLAVFRTILAAALWGTILYLLFEPPGDTPSDGEQKLGEE